MCCPPEERAQPLDAYWRRILDADPAVHGPAARAWHDTERILSEHAPTRVRLDLGSLNSTRALPSTPFMEAHYFQNDCFMKPNQLLAEAGKLAGIPGIIVQGRYDLLCPPATSHALAAVWPNSEVRFVEGAGHSLYDPGVRDAVMKAIADLASSMTPIKTSAIRQKAAEARHPGGFDRLWFRRACCTAAKAAR